MTRDVVICEPVRTAVGRYGGVLRDVSAAELGATALCGLLERTKLPPEAIGDVVVGHGFPSSEAPSIGRVIALDAGLPDHVTGLQIDRRCGSGLQAVLYAATLNVVRWEKRAGTVITQVEVPAGRGIQPTDDVTRTGRVESDDAAA